MESLGSLPDVAHAEIISEPVADEDDLPSEPNESEPEDPLFCDQCEVKDKSEAVCYCKVCDRKLCKHHEKV